MATENDKNRELSNQFKEVKEKLDKLADEYHSDRKLIIAVAALFGVFTLAFFGLTVANIPGVVRETVNTTVGQETIRVIQEYKIKIEVQATQIAQYATAAGNDANDIKKFKENLPRDNAVLDFVNCGNQYSCTPRACLAKCIEFGMRMATYDEVYSWASSGIDHCAVMWMLDSKQSDTPITGYPMYHNQTTESVCGRTDTGDVPRMEGVTIKSWDSSDEFDCACSSLK